MSTINTNSSILDSLKNDQCILLSVCVISDGTVNDNDDSKSKNNIAILNITHTDSFNQNINDRINSLYSQLNAKYIFPIVIYKNNLQNTLLSTGNINRLVQQIIYSNINNYKINILIDDVKQRIPRQNYILSNELISYFIKICQGINLECIYKSSYASNILSFINEIKLTHNIDLFEITNNKFSLSENQIKYFRQYGLTNNLTVLKKRSRDSYERINTNTNLTNNNIYDGDKDFNNIDFSNVFEDFTD